VLVEFRVQLSYGFVTPSLKRRPLSRLRLHFSAAIALAPPQASSFGVWHDRWELSFPLVSIGSYPWPTAIESDHVEYISDTFARAQRKSSIGASLAISPIALAMISLFSLRTLPKSSESLWKCPSPSWRTINLSIEASNGENGAEPAPTCGGDRVCRGRGTPPLQLCEARAGYRLNFPLSQVYPGATTNNRLGSRS
jgi:hypothetical protein